MRRKAAQAEAVEHQHFSGGAAISGQWSEAEDELLRQLVLAHGVQQWAGIAKELPGRTAKTCKNRWFHKLAPGTGKTGFHEWEDAIIAQAQRKHGSRWALISKLLPSRTEGAVKERWHSVISKQDAAANPYMSYDLDTLLAMNSMQLLSSGMPLPAAGAIRDQHVQLGRRGRQPATGGVISPTASDAAGSSDSSKGGQQGEDTGGQAGECRTPAPICTRCSDSAAMVTQQQHASPALQPDVPPVPGSSYSPHCNEGLRSVSAAAAAATLGAATAAAASPELPPCSPCAIPQSPVKRRRTGVPPPAPRPSLQPLPPASPQQLEQQQPNSEAASPLLRQQQSPQQEGAAPPRPPAPLSQPASNSPEPARQVAPPAAASPTHQAPHPPPELGPCPPSSLAAPQEESAPPESPAAPAPLLGSNGWRFHVSGDVGELLAFAGPSTCLHNLLGSSSLDLMGLGSPLAGLGTPRASMQLPLKEGGDLGGGLGTPLLSLTLQAVLREMLQQQAATKRCSDGTAAAGGAAAGAEPGRFSRPVIYAGAGGDDRCGGNDGQTAMDRAQGAAGLPMEERGARLGRQLLAPTSGQSSCMPPPAAIVGAGCRRQPAGGMLRGSPQALHLLPPDQRACLLAVARMYVSSNDSDPLSARAEP
mmetsp:Transcript_12403/g.26794  ORF Transcript_12403/g.26794 Transcript_12403/m.26794 type:complete len:646 (+) Transcript_12403:53-1990(+)